MSDNMTTEEFLEHYGVKGMKWGRRRTDAQLGKAKISRKENKRLNSEAKAKFDQKKAKSILKESAKKGDRVLVETQYAGDPYKTLTTGTEFVNAMTQGKAFNLDATEVFARQAREGEQFVLNDSPIGKYKTQNFRKQSK